jgi:hypothetical protein
LSWHQHRTSAVNLRGTKFPLKATAVYFWQHTEQFVYRALVQVLGGFSTLATFSRGFLSKVISAIPVHDIKRLSEVLEKAALESAETQAFTEAPRSSAVSVLALCGIQSTKIDVSSSNFAPQGIKLHK